MKKLLPAFLALGMGLGLAACGGGNAIDDALKEMASRKDKICACKDSGCIDKEKESYQKWMEGLEGKMKDQKPSKEQDEKFDKLDDQIDECVAKVKEGEAGIK